MIAEISESDIKTPVLIGGGVNASNVNQALRVADGIIVSSAFKPVGGFNRETLQMDWDAGKIKKFMDSL
jgi:predicted TIM-barrel enzyme